MNDNTDHSDLPKKLQHLFDEQGYVTINQFRKSVGVSYTFTLGQCAAGLGVNCGEPGKRAIWRIFEKEARQWFVQRRRTSRIQQDPPELNVGEIPNFYDASGNWIPPEQRPAAQ